MRCFIVKHDEPIELSFKHFHLTLSYGLGSFMSHIKCCPNILGHIQTIYMVEIFLSIDEVRMNIA
jgi:hypothetical protein